MTTTSTLNPPPTSEIAAASVDAVKIYGKGDTEVRALDGISVEFPAPVHRHHGPVGLGQVHVDALPRRSRHAHERAGADRAGRSHHPRREAPHVAAPRPGRVRLPGLQPGADAQRAREHPAAPRPRPSRTRPGVARPRDRHRRSARAAHASAVRALRRPATARRRRPGAGLAAGDHLRRRTDRATSIRAPAPRFSRSCARPSKRTDRRSSW